METFIKKEIKGKSIEMYIDTAIFPKNIILKAAFDYLDIGYFFFKSSDNGNIIAQYTPKEWTDTAAEVVLWNFSDTLLEVYLRDKLEKENKVIRESIVTKALFGPMERISPRKENSIELWDPNSQESQLDFDKDIDDIIRDIENDPDLQIDEKEIQQILNEIEHWNTAIPKPVITVNSELVKKVKKDFKKKK